MHRHHDWRQDFDRSAVETAIRSSVARLGPLLDKVVGLEDPGRRRWRSTLDHALWEARQCLRAAADVVLSSEQTVELQRLLERAEDLALRAASVDALLTPESAASVAANVQ